MRKFNFKKKLGIFLAVLVVFVAVIASAAFCLPQKTAAAAEIEDYNVTELTEDDLELLSGDVSSLESSYNIRTENPLLTENQTSSNFCWTYASLKALESAFMVQHNEYHNFADVGMAYAYFYDQMEQYKGGITNTQAVFNSSGNFFKFNLTLKNYGLLYENEFANVKLADINDSNYLNYEYLLDLADKNIIKRIRPVTLSGVTENVLKAFIKRYGGVFAGIEGGTVFTDGKIYAPNVVDGQSKEMYIAGNHAVTLIGWDDSNNTFRALNSWGVETTFNNGMKNHEEFNIPDSYEKLYYNIYGYIIEDEDEVVTVGSNARDFSQTIKERTQPIINMFTYPETLTLSYQLDEKFNFKNVHTRIFQGTEDATVDFAISYDDENRKITIYEKDFSHHFKGGTFLIKFYEGVKVIGTKEFVIYTGTELSYVQIFKYVEVDADHTELPEDDIYTVMNTLAAPEDTATYYLYAGDTYYLKFFLTDLYKLGSGMIFDNVVSSQITTARAYNYSNGSVTETQIPSFTVTSKQQYGGYFEITLSGLSAYAGQMIEFEIYINSTMYSGVTKAYHFQLFLSSDPEIHSNDAYRIEYVLDGGVNSSTDPDTLSAIRNIERYPNYKRESNNGNEMTSFSLVAPTKANHQFLGWFTDPDFSPDSRVFVIDSTFAGDLVLYAKWEPYETQLFDLTLEMTKVTAYGGVDKTNDNPLKIIYGDALEFVSNFTIDASIEGLFTAKFHFLVNGVEFNSIDLTDSAVMNLTIDHEDLLAGNYSVQAVISVVISHLEQGAQAVELEFVVHKKELVVDYDAIHSTLTYDGSYHEPIVSLFGKYDFDAELEFEWDKELQCDAGEYLYFMTKLSNDNYYVDFSHEYKLTISPRELSVNWINLSVTYDGMTHKPVCEVDESDLVAGDSVQVKFNLSGLKNAGKYNILIESLMNKNYKAKTADAERVFEIKPATLTLTFKPMTERVQTQPVNRPKITSSSYTVTGTLYGSDELNLTINCLGLTATKSGVYPVTASYINDNYKINVVNGKYILTGYYYVDYILPNGEVYRERVEDGEDPSGITREIYDIPSLSAFTYSQALKNTGDDLSITVTVTNYAWIVYTSVVVITMGAIYWFITRKARMNKVS